MHITPLQGELEILEHRRERLEEMLASDIVSDELRIGLSENLAIVESRIAALRWPQGSEAIRSRAA
jgi:hypothetical protein